MSAEHLDSLRRLLRDHLVKVLSRRHAIVVDGGTHSGVMTVMGEALQDARGEVPLVGVAADQTVRVPGRQANRDDAADLDPNHTSVFLVPGKEWGDESKWISATASVLAGGAPSVTLVVNGGQITFDDVQCSVDAHRPVLVAAGTGRTADILAVALRGEDAGLRKGRRLAL